MVTIHQNPGPGRHGSPESKAARRERRKQKRMERREMRAREEEARSGEVRVKEEMIVVT